METKVWQQKYKPTKKEIKYSNITIVDFNNADKNKAILITIK